MDLSIKMDGIFGLISLARITDIDCSLSRRTSKEAKSRMHSFFRCIIITNQDCRLSVCQVDVIGGATQDDISQAAEAAVISHNNV
jgi:hypothetical protein